jgi:hypothetical protein
MVNQHERRFRGVVFLPCAEQEEHTAFLQVERDQQQQGKKENGLMSDDKSGELSLPGDIFPGEGKERNVYIRIEVALIGMTVMTVVLFHPPGVAHADEQIACDQANEVIFPRLMKNLPVSSLVAEQSKLRGDKSQKDRIEQLKPEKVYQQQESNA